jgi:hypothetical protein
MKLAIMQPYLFPYIGYYQLMNLVDNFIIYDDVTYINKSWINRNRILLNKEEFYFTIPLRNKSQNILIKDLKLAMDVKWKKNFMQTLTHAYSKAPYFGNIYSLINTILDTENLYFRDLYYNSFSIINKYLDINSRLLESSKIFLDKKFKGEQKIIALCLNQGASSYYNLSGGKNLYDNNNFNLNNIELKFIKPRIQEQKTNKYLFSRGLSIIDDLMFCEKSELKRQLMEFNIT